MAGKLNFKPAASSLNKLWMKLIEELRNSNDVDHAVEACQAISKNADETCVPDLYILLQDEDFFIREAAADPLARLEGVSRIVKEALKNIRRKKGGFLSKLTSLFNEVELFG